VVRLASRALVCLFATTFLGQPAVQAQSRDEAASDAVAGDAMAERTPLAELLDYSQAPALVRRTLFRTQTLLQRGNEDEALDALREHLDRHPDQDHPLVRFHLGRILLERSDEQAALPHLRAAVADDPRLWPAWRGLGQAAYATGAYVEAAEAFVQVFRRQPDPPPLLLHYAAAAYLQAGDAASALPLVEDLVSGRLGDPLLTWYRTHLAVVLELHRPGLATAATRDLVRRFADSPDAWYLAYQQAVAADDLERAAAALETAGYLRRLTTSEELQLGDLYRAIGVPVVAARHFAAAVAEAPTADSYERLVSSLLAAHRRDEALAVLDDALATDATARLWALKGDILYLNDDFARAQEAFRSAVVLAPESGRPHLMLGYCAWELGQREAAADHLRTAIGFPNEAEAAERALRAIGAR
jgi:tetratricopeptide (TPR) repeat protein